MTSARTAPHDALAHWIAIADPGSRLELFSSIFRPEPKQLLLPLSSIARQVTPLSISGDTE